MKRKKDRSRHPGTWEAGEERVLARLTSPVRIQEFLDSLPYSAEARYRSPRSVLADRMAHCYDGAVFAAMALRRLGYPPLIIDMDGVRDDDHVIALFKKNGRFGAVAKSNFVGLRYREPVFHSLRELVMSYFESYYNVAGEKTLRQYTRPLNLSSFDRLGWYFSDEALDVIGEALNEVRITKIITPAMARSLSRVDKRSYEAGMVGANKKGLHKVAG